MQKFATKTLKDIGWGVPTSVALHIVVAFVLLIRLPELPQASQESVDVELVSPPPPEEKSKEEQQPNQQQQPQAFEAATAEPNTEMPQDRSPPQQPVETAENGSSENGRDASAELQSPSKKQDAQNFPLQKQKPEQIALTQDTKTNEQALTLKNAIELYSEKALNDPRVKQALGKLPPQERVIQICSIEALEQIRHHQPGTFPDMLARDGGSVSDSGLTVSNGAFRSGSKWYAVDFQCQINVQAMTVKSFRYAIGKSIPEREWNGRQLPKD